MVAFEGRSADGGADGSNEEGVQKQEGEHETEVVQQKGVLKEVLEEGTGAVYGGAVEAVGKVGLASPIAAAAVMPLLVKALED